MSKELIEKGAGDLDSNGNYLQVMCLIQMVY